MFLGRDDEDGLFHSQSSAGEARNRVDKALLVLVELDDVIVFGRLVEERLAPGPCFGQRWLAFPVDGQDQSQGRRFVGHATSPATRFAATGVY